jgi:hypothetical protein
MLRQHTAGTISSLSIGLLVLIVSLASLGTHVSAVARLEAGTATSTRTTTPTPTPCDDDQDICDSDATDAAFDATDAAASALTATAAITPSPGTATTTVTTTTRGLGTPTGTLLPTNFPTTAPLIPSPIQATSTLAAEQLVPTETPTTIPDSTLTCFPGQPLVLTGDGPPRAAFLVYFGQRAVSGGSVTPNGRFATTLIIGREHAGVYPITVRVRGTTKVLLATSCAVPDVTPTLIPRARDLP